MHWGGDLWPWLGSVGCQMAARARVVLCACFWGVSGGMPAKWAPSFSGVPETGEGALEARAVRAQAPAVRFHGTQRLHLQRARERLALTISELFHPICWSSR